MEIVNLPEGIAITNRDDLGKVDIITVKELRELIVWLHENKNGFIEACLGEKDIRRRSK